MDIQEKTLVKQTNKVIFKKLWPYFTKEEIELYDNDYIGFHPMIPDKTINEIIDMTERLDNYLKVSWDGKFDFHYHSQGGCYFLSSIFCLSNSNWYLIQGEFVFENKENHYYHSWIQKENIIFDPAMRVVTLDSLYSEFFLS